MSGVPSLTREFRSNRVFREILHTAFAESTSTFNSTIIDASASFSSSVNPPSTTNTWDEGSPLLGASSPLIGANIAGSSSPRLAPNQGAFTSTATLSHPLVVSRVGIPLALHSPLLPVFVELVDVLCTDAAVSHLSCPPSVVVLIFHAFQVSPLHTPITDYFFHFVSPLVLYFLLSRLVNWFIPSFIPHHDSLGIMFSKPLVAFSARSNLNNLGRGDQLLLLL